MTSPVDETTTTPAEAPLRVLACAMALAAGLIHAASIGSHPEDATFTVLFALAAMVGVAWGVVAWARTDRLVLGVGLVAHATFLAFYVVTRVSGVSFVDSLHGAQPVGTADLMAALFEFGVVLATAVLIAAPGPLGRTRAFGARSWTVALAVSALCLPGLVESTDAVSVAAPAAREVSGAPDDGGSASATTSEPTTTTTAKPKAFDPTQPVDLSGTPGVTAAEQARAEDLLRRTLRDLPQWAEQRTAFAAGYRSIGDGSTGHEHLLNWSIINDTTTLDPNHPEALVYNTLNGTPVLEAAMFILPDTYTLQTTPDLGGPLTQWHIHDDLCFTQGSAPQVAGMTMSNGSCPGGLVKFTPAPMVHVWITPNPCGPFAALEGVGAGQVKAGETRSCDHVHGTGTF